MRRPIQIAVVLLTVLPHWAREGTARVVRAVPEVASTSVVRSDTLHVAPPTGDKEIDRRRVQAAFDSVGPGGTILFAPGTYLLGEGVQLTVPDVTVLGHPRGTVLRGCDPEAFAVDSAGLGSVVFGCTGFYVQTARQTIRDLAFEYVWHGIVVGPYPANAEEAESDGSGESRLADYPAGGQRIEGNTFRATPNGLRVLGVGDELSEVRDNDFIDVYHAIGIYGAPLHFVDNRVTVEEPGRVPYSGHPGSAILISPGQTDCAGHVVARNRIEGYPGAIYVLAGSGESCRGVEIRENTIDVRRVTVPRASASATPTEEDSTMVGVPITLLSDGPRPDTSTAGANGGVEDVVVEGNRLNGAEGLGILVDGSRNRISGNTITGIRRRVPFPGITWIGDAGTTWELANGSAIWISPGSDGNAIVGNTFGDVQAAAVFLEGDGNRVELSSPSDSVHDRGTGNEVAAVGSAGADPIADSLIAIEKAAWEAWIHHDVAFFQDYLAEEALRVHLNGRFDRAQQLEDVAEHPCQVRDYTLDDFEVMKLADDVRALTYESRADVTCAGEVQPPRTLSTVVFVRRRGAWVNLLYQETLRGPGP